MVTNEEYDNPNCWDSAKVRGPSSILGSPDWGYCMGKRAPCFEENPSSFEGQRDLHLETQRAAENRDSALKRTHTKSRTFQDGEQRLSYERSWIRPLASLKKLPGEEGGNQRSLWGCRC